MSELLDMTPGRPKETLLCLDAILAPVAARLVLGQLATMDAYEEAAGHPDFAYRENAEVLWTHAHDTGERNAFMDPEMGAVETMILRGSALVLDGERSLLWATDALIERVVNAQPWQVRWSYKNLIPLADAIVPENFKIGPTLWAAGMSFRAAIGRDPSLRRERWRLRRIQATWDMMHGRVAS